MLKPPEQLFYLGHSSLGLNSFCGGSSSKGTIWSAKPSPGRFVIAVKEFHDSLEELRGTIRVLRLGWLRPFLR